MRLTTTRRRSGKERSVILGYFEDGPNLVTMAMSGWPDGEPAWWLDLQANPAARVDVRGGGFAVLRPGAAAPPDAGIVAPTDQRTRLTDRAETRSIPFERWWNVRDLGGLPTGDGGTTRHGVLMRAASPEFATPADIDHARSLGLTTFVDLRMPGHAPDWRDAAPDVTKVDVNLVGSLSRPRDVTAEQLPRFLLDSGRFEVARVIGVVTMLGLRSPPLVFHCHTGKDRTGVIAIVLLSLASVPEEAIVADYLASNPGFEAMRDALAADAASTFMAGAPAAVRGPVSRRGAEEAVRFLAESGGVAAYLESAGLPPDQVERAASLLR